MTTTSAPSVSTGSTTALSTWPRTLRRCAGLLAVSLLTVVLLAGVDTERVLEPSGGAHVELGLPLPWLVQDQTSVDPAYPTDLGLASPWEHPTDISLPLLVLDVLLTALVLLVLLAAARSVVRAATRGTHAPRSGRGLTAGTR